MTNVAPTPTSGPRYIAELLGTKKVHKIAIIDDADDPLTRGELYAGEVNEFWTLLIADHPEEQEELKQFIHETLGRDLRRDKDIDDVVLQTLWANRNKLGRLKDPLDRVLFPKVIEKVSQLDRFQQHLESELNLEVFRQGTNIDVVEDLKGVSIVFIDYVLGPETDEQGSIERAERLTRDIYSAYSPSEMPLIILMSSLEKAKGDEESFRDRSGLLRGMFYFASKNDLGDKDQLILNLAAWAKTLPTTVDIQRFVKTLEDAKDVAWDTFIRGVKSLSLGDYAYIQFLSLQDDGHPLGDYMLWLFNSYLGHLFFEGHRAMQEQQKVVDELSSTTLPPKQTMPSDQLVKMYQSALFNMNVEDVAGHPVITAMQREGATETPSSSMPMLHLGDLFIKDGDSQVLMVLNADCDLAFGPKRACDLNGTVLLIPGELRTIDKWGESSNQPVTDFFEYEGKRYRINWDTKKVYSYRYSDLESQLSNNNYHRRARLRLPFALEIQRAFAANLTRVGMPTAPPIYHSVKVEILARMIDKEGIALVVPTDDLAFWVLIKSNNKYEKQVFLTVQFGHILKKAIGEYEQKLEQQFRGLAESEDAKEQTKAKKLRRRIAALSEFRSDFESWFLELKSIQLPAEGRAVRLNTDLVGLTRGRNIKDEYKDPQDIIINIIDPVSDKQSDDTGTSLQDAEKTSAGEAGAQAARNDADVPSSTTDITPSSGE